MTEETYLNRPFDPLFSFERDSHVSHRINFFPSSLLGSNVFPRLASHSCFCALSILKYLKRVLFSAFGIGFFFPRFASSWCFPTFGIASVSRASHGILVFPRLAMLSCIWHWIHVFQRWHGSHIFPRMASDLFSRA